jgi:hypothetical protein
MSALAIFAILFLIVFIAGTLAGIFLIVCWASRREDKNKTIKGAPPGNGASGARYLTGVGRRGSTRDPAAEHADLDASPGRGQNR